MDSVKFSIGETVYHRASAEEKGIVTGILFRPTGVCYYVTWKDRTESASYEIELNKEKSYRDIT